MSYGELLIMCGVQMSLYAEFRGALYERLGQISAFRREVDENCVLVGQRFLNFFQVGTTFISQNVLRTTLLLGLSNSLGLP